MLLVLVISLHNDIVTRVSLTLSYVRIFFFSPSRCVWRVHRKPTGMESWQPNPRAQPIIPKRGGLYISQTLIARPLGRRRLVTKIFQVRTKQDIGFVRVCLAPTKLAQGVTRLGSWILSSLETHRRENTLLCLMLVCWHYALLFPPFPLLLSREGMVI